MKRFSGWYRLFLMYAGLWTAFAGVLTAVVIKTTRTSMAKSDFDFWGMVLVWFVPIGFVYYAGCTAEFIIKGFRKETAI